MGEGGKKKYFEKLWLTFLQVWWKSQPIHSRRTSTKPKQENKEIRKTENYAKTHYSHIARNGGKKRRKKIFKVSREKNTHYRGTIIRMISDFWSEIIQAREQWIISLNYWEKNKNSQLRILYPMTIYFKIEDEGRPGDSVGWGSDSWFPFRWSPQGCEIKPLIRQQAAQHWVCMRDSLPPSYSSPCPHSCSHTGILSLSLKQYPF